MVEVLTREPIKTHRFDYFEQKDVWQSFLQQDLYYRQKARIMLAMIPEDTKTVLDAGCGNGELTALLSQNYWTVGIDRSYQALTYQPFRSVLTDVSKMSIRDSSFDLIFCSELLEHLTNQELQKTVVEFQRIARNYILISVPFNENLNLRKIKCPACAHVFHIWGHQQRFNFGRIQSLFLKFKLVSWAHCGNHAFDYHPLLLLIKQKILGVWYDTSHALPLCPECGNKDFRVKSFGFLVNWLNEINRLYFKRHIANKPYWIVALYERS